MWSADAYLESLGASVKPELAFKAETAAELRAWQAGLRARFIDLLGGFPAARAALDAEELESVDCGDYTRKRIAITTYEGLRMPCYLLIPKELQAPAPAVIACHGHGYGSKEIVGLDRDGRTTDNPGYQKNFALALVRSGYVTLAPELFGFGERMLRVDAGERNSCHRLSTFLLAMGRTMAGHRVYETVRCIDYLQTLDVVDKEKIGIMGISGGGLVAAFTSAVDERIQAAVVSGYFNTFRASILSLRHCVDNYVPGLSAVTEMPDLFGLIAPRPLLIESGVKDHIFPIEAARDAFLQLRRIYEQLGAADRLEMEEFAHGHEIGGGLAYGWFGRWMGS